FQSTAIVPARAQAHLTRTDSLILSSRKELGPNAVATMRKSFLRESAHSTLTSMAMGSPATSNTVVKDSESIISRNCEYELDCHFRSSLQRIGYTSCRRMRRLNSHRLALFCNKLIRFWISRLNDLG